jgi:protease II
MNSFLRTPKVSPVVDSVDGWEYWNQTTEFGPIHWRKPAGTPNSQQELVLSPGILGNHLAKKICISPSHTYVGYILESPGDEFGSLWIRNIKTKQIFEVKSPHRIFTFEFLDDFKVIYAAIGNEELRPDEVYVQDWRYEEHHLRYRVPDASFVDLGKTKDKVPHSFTTCSNLRSILER